MEQKLELLEKEQQKLRQEVDSLHEIINILQTQMLDEANKILEKNFDFDDSCDIIEISSVSDEYSVSNEDGYFQETIDMNESLITKIENIMESKLEEFKDCIINTIKDEKEKEMRYL